MLAAPTITRQPETVQVTSGQNATLVTSATGVGSLTYQWLRRGHPLVGETSPTLVVGRADVADADFYSVKVTDQSGSTVSQSVRLRVAPRAYPSSIAVDPRYNAMFETVSSVRVSALAALPDGGFYAAGAFSRVDGEPRSMIIRVDANGALDRSFVVPDITGYIVHRILVDSDGRILIAGQFSRVGYHRRNGLARLNVDGSLDEAFDPFQSYSYIPSVTGWAALPDGKMLVATFPESVVKRYRPDGTVDETFTPISTYVNALAVQDDGKIVLGGFVGGLGASGQGLSRYLPDGTPDNTFATVTFEGTVNTVVIGRDGIYVGRSPHYGSTISGIVRYTSTGALDTRFSATVDGTVRGIVEQGDQLVIAGGFMNVNGRPEAYVARLTRSGASVPFLTSSPGIWVDALALLASGDIVIGGLQSWPGAPQRGIARFSRDGVQRAAPHFLFRMAGEVKAMTRLPSGRFMAFGLFDFVDNVPTKNIARLNPDGSVDASFQVTADTNLTYGNMQGAVALPDGRSLIYGALANPARPLLLVGVDGLADPAFTASLSPLTAVYSADILPNGNIVAGGAFIDPSYQATGGVAVYRLNGTLDPNFGSGTQFDREVRRVVALPSGEVLVSGYFSKFKGTNIGPLVRLKPDGSLDPTFVLKPALSSVNDFEVAPDGQIYALGAFAGDLTQRIFRLNSDGSHDPTFVAGLVGVPSSVYPQEDGKVVARFVRQAGVSTPELVRFNADGTVDPTFRSTAVLPTTSFPGKVWFTRDDGHVIYTEDIAAGRLRLTANVQAPVFTRGPTTTTVAAGGSATLQAEVESVIPVKYQWLFNGTPITGATGRSYTVANFHAAQQGQYSVRITNELGTVTSSPAWVTAPLNTRGHLVNLSIRANAGAGDNRLIVGLVLGGANTGGDKQLLIRGVGPTLSKFGVGAALGDPVLELYDGTQFKIDQNDDWTGVYDFSQVGAFPFEGAAPKDSAIYNPFATVGAQTVHVLGKDNASGVVLAEIYDATPAAAFTLMTPRFLNGSARTYVGAGDDVLILGFVIGGSSSQRVLIRAGGPTIGAAPYHVPGVLSDPTLDIYDADHRLIARNNNWGDNNAAGTLAPLFESVGAFPFAGPGSKDAALVITLAPGRYSAVVRGANGGTGVALAELYELNE